jgi:hypothetical protein
MKTQIKPIPEYPKKSRFLLEFVNVWENKFMFEKSSLKLIWFYKFDKQYPISTI